MIGILLFLLSVALVQEAHSTEDVFIVVGQDTASSLSIGTRQIQEINGQDTIFAFSKGDTIRTTATVGDTLVVEFHVKNWPDIVGYGFRITTRNRSRDGSFYRPGSFYPESPTTQGGLVWDGSVAKIGQVGIGISGEESGHLGDLVVVFDRPGVEELVVVSGFYLILGDLGSGAIDTLDVATGLSVFIPLTPQPIEVTADFDGDGVIGFGDFPHFSVGFGSRRGDSGYSFELDFDDDGSIDFRDFLLMAADFGKAPTVYRTISRD